MNGTVVTLTEVEEKAREVALCEAAMAHRAASMAEQASDEAVHLAKEDLATAEEWSRVSRQLAGLAFGHYVRAASAAPGSRAARSAKEDSALAAGHAHAAELAVRRD